MASLPPKIDQRTYEEIVDQTKDLAKQYSDWQPASDGKKDAGEALIRIFARMVKTVSDRLNQVPDKNFLAYLDLIGGELIPPQPAKVPLTFYLAEGSSEDTLVPAQTQVSALDPEDSESEIVFESDRELIVTTAQLQGVYVRNPDQDKYSDRTSAATGQKDEAFCAFSGDTNIEHALYISCPEIFALPELESLDLTITVDSETLDSLAAKLHWFYWDGFQWQILEETSTPTYDENIFTFTELPILNATEVDGRTEKWLQAKLTNIDSETAENLPQVNSIEGSVEVNKPDLIPEVCLYNNTPLDLSKDFYPFGEQPQLNDTFYIALDDTFVKPDAIVTIDITLSNDPENTESEPITWEVGNGQVWQAITINGTAGALPVDELTEIAINTSIQFTESISIQAKLQFPSQEKMPLPSTVNGETGYWIRARITDGCYGTAEQIRQYPVYNDSAFLTTPASSTQITVSSVDLLKVQDTICLVPNAAGFSEYHQINSIDNMTLTLDRNIDNDTLEAGTRVMRQTIITETIPPTYDPPLVESLKLSYEFTINEDAIYLANNDFNYSRPNSVPFSPFTPTIDQEPTLYFGFDQSFENKTVTLYAQVEPPLPDELASDITKETSLEAGATQGQTEVTLYDATGWQTGGNLEIQNDRYTISNIPIDPDNQITLYQPLQQTYPLDTPVIYPQQSELVWEYSSPYGWQPLAIEDETESFSQSGLIQFIAPADFSTRENFGKQLYWMRVRWHSGNFRVPPRLRRLLTNTMEATQAITLKEEVLGSSTADANQVFLANNAPILQGQTLEVEEGEISTEIKSDRLTIIEDELGEIESVWVLWQEVADFYASGASDRHYILDRQTGEIRFGDGIVGMIPPRGQNNIRLSCYRTGGGKQGNLNLETIDQLKTTIPYIDRVINHTAASGGAEQETLEHLKERVPKQLRHRDRAVTIDDIADLAYEASTDVARVKVATPDIQTPDFSPLDESFWLDPNNSDISFSETTWDQNQTMEEIHRRAGQVKLIVLPQSSDRQPVPSIGLLKRVENYILCRSQPTMSLIVTAPQWQEVTVNVTITPVSLEGGDMLRNLVKQRLEEFLHPLTGGTGDGWQFGRNPHESDFYAIIQAIPEVDYVKELTIDPDPDIGSSLSADTLIYSGNHVVDLSG